MGHGSGEEVARLRVKSGWGGKSKLKRTNKFSMEKFCAALRVRATRTLLSHVRGVEKRVNA